MLADCEVLKCRFQCGKASPANDSNASRFQTCAGCKYASYCSRNCQAGHWKAGHKENCKKNAERHFSGGLALGFLFLFWLANAHTPTLSLFKERHAMRQRSDYTALTLAVAHQHGTAIAEMIDARFPNVDPQKIVLFVNIAQHPIKIGLFHMDDLEATNRFPCGAMDRECWEGLKRKSERVTDGHYLFFTYAMDGFTGGYVSGTLLLPRRPAASGVLGVGLPSKTPCRRPAVTLEGTKIASRLDIVDLTLSLLFEGKVMTMSDQWLENGKGSVEKVEAIASQFARRD